MGSGLNHERKRFVDLMGRVGVGEIKEIVVAHKDSLLTSVLL